MNEHKAVVDLDTNHDVTATLRILATTDLHANLIAWDYYSHRPCDSRGLSRIATLIDAARAEVHGSILLDNGDFLAGSGLGDYMVRQWPAGLAHPMIAAMNALGYDAVNLGNHEFSHGLPFLRRALCDAAFPVLCTNYEFDDLSLVQRWALVVREVVDSREQLRKLTVGVMGLLPAQTMVWEGATLGNAARAHPMAQAARAMAQDLRRNGADVVIALAHTGLAGYGADFGEDRHANIIADIPEIDVVIAGHSHQVFPQETPDSDGRAVILPGFFGSHLGVVDLALVHNGTAWSLARHSKSLRPISARDPHSGRVAALTKDSGHIRALAEPMHTQITAQAQQVIGTLPHRLHTYFSTITSCAAMALIAAAQAHHLAQMLPQTTDAGLPILSAVAPFKAGGLGGPENYTDLPAGPFRHHHATDLYLHPNSFVAFRLNGREVALWLERSASKYNQIPKGAQDAPLINPDFPSFNFDLIFGLTYQIDLTQPAMFDGSGNRIGAAPRIRNLQYRGQPLRDDQVFALASNSYRRESKSGFAGTDQAHIICDRPILVQDMLRDYVAKGHPCPNVDPQHLRFAPQVGSTVIFNSAPRAAEVLTDIAHMRPKPLERMETGFQRFRLHL